MASSSPTPSKGLSAAIILTAVFGGILVVISLYMTIAPAVLIYRDGSHSTAALWFLWGLAWTVHWLNMTVKGVGKGLLLARIQQAQKNS